MAQKKRATQKNKNRSSDTVKPPPCPSVKYDGKPKPTGDGSKPPDNPPAAGLHLIATPIGNASDISLRAMDILGQADLVACEDTRTSGKLLAIHGISARLTPYHEHNADRVRPNLIRRLKNGETVALVSDAGTPLVSDPGYKLVRDCIEMNIPVTAVPGPSAILTALILSGLPMDRFMFAGFLPNRSAGRRSALTELGSIAATLVFMESPHRLAASLRDMADVLGDRKAVVARELTKMFEEVRRATLCQLAEHYRTNDRPKGEIMIVVAPCGKPPPPEGKELDREILEALEHLSLRDACAGIAASTGLPRQKIYARALELKRQERRENGDR